MEIVLHLTGTRPMLQHNGRLANPLDPHTRALKQLTAKRRKTDEDLMAIATAEARAAIYETHDELLGLPSQNVWRCLYDAAKAFKRGEDIKRSLSVGDVVEPILLDGEPVKVVDFLSDVEHIDYRGVKMQRATVMRARPKVPEGWTSTHTFELFEDVLDQRDLVPIIERAGRLVGVGDWRPTYGLFVAEMA